MAVEDLMLFVCILVTILLSGLFCHYAEQLELFKKAAIFWFVGVISGFFSGMLCILIGGG